MNFKKYLFSWYSITNGFQNDWVEKDKDGIWLKRKIGLLSILPFFLMSYRPWSDTQGINIFIQIFD